MDRELKAELTAEEIVFSLKYYGKNEWLYYFQAENSDVLETKLTPQGELVKSIIVKILLRDE